MDFKEVQSCNLINTAANPNSDGIFVTVMQQPLHDTHLPRAKHLFFQALFLQKRFLSFNQKPTERSNGA